MDFNCNLFKYFLNIHQFASVHLPCIIEFLSKSPKAFYMLSTQLYQSAKNIEINSKDPCVFFKNAYLPMILKLNHALFSNPSVLWLEFAVHCDVTFQLKSNSFKSKCQITWILSLLWCHGFEIAQNLALFHSKILANIYYKMFLVNIPKYPKQLIKIISVLAVQVQIL